MTEWFTAGIGRVRTPPLLFRKGRDLGLHQHEKTGDTGQSGVLRTGERRKNNQPGIYLSVIPRADPLGHGQHQNPWGPYPLFRFFAI